MDHDDVAVFLFKTYLVIPVRSERIARSKYRVSMCASYQSLVANYLIYLNSKYALNSLVFSKSTVIRVLRFSMNLPTMEHAFHPFRPLVSGYPHAPLNRFAELPIWLE